MGLPDLIHESKLMRRQRDDRLWIAAAEWPCPIQHSNEVRRHRARADCAIDEQLVDMASLGHRIRQLCFNVGAKLRKTFFPQRDASGHGVATALQEDPLQYGFTDGF